VLVVSSAKNPKVSDRVGLMLFATVCRLGRCQRAQMAMGQLLGRNEAVLEPDPVLRAVL